MNSSSLKNYRIQSFTEVQHISPDINDTNNLQEISYALPDNSIFTHDVSVRSSFGWQKQIPEDYGYVKIEKKYNSRVYIFYYPVDGKCFYLCTYNSNNSPSLIGWHQFNGTPLWKLETSLVEKLPHIVIKM